ncbi:hypothetical protein GQ53DRAFT_837274 [Thozetella sp. PMI_491]|nr:hypothetical protein GQ53DRAFT_837274 [Thozetella sp. PMI_491]
MRSSAILCSALGAIGVLGRTVELVARDTTTTVTISQAQDAASGALVSGDPKTCQCPEFDKGSFDIHAYQLYPENMDWDANLCQVYIGVLFNASFGIYHPYEDKLDVIEFPGITHNLDFHIGGVGWDKYTGLASVIVGQGNAFGTSGANISGDNFIKKFDPRTKKFLWSHNLTALTQGAWGGFNDVTTDPAGNTYICGTFPSSIVKVDAKGNAPTAWVPPVTTDHTKRGYSGIASNGNTIVALDSNDGSLWRFDATAAQGTPVPLPRTPNATISGGDGIHLPVLYNGHILLVAEHVRGVSVLRSQDGSWASAEYLGLIPNAPGLPAGVLAVSTTQIANKLYIVNDWFGDAVVPGTQAGNKTSFPMIEITHQVQNLICKADKQAAKAKRNVFLA